jgi:3-phosphoshikimate 1-carboxyvinyltransferase
VTALGQLGVEIEVDGTTARVGGIAGRWPRSSGRIYVGSAGTVARFLPPAICSAGSGEWYVDASAQMRTRPMGPLFTALAELGVQVEFPEQPDRFPVVLKSSGLAGGAVSISGNVSSQFLSGLLIASPYARSPVVLRVPDSIVQSAYVRMTLAMMAAFGVRVDASDSLDRCVVPLGSYVGRELTLEPDVSAAAYFMALAALTGQTARIAGLSRQTDQPDIGILDILSRMGCAVSWRPDGVDVTGPRQLAGGFTVDMRALSDQALTVAALAVFADAPITITGVEHIRAHESDRIAVACENLRRLGVSVDEHADGLTVRPGPLQPGAVDPHDDHRVAMSFALLGARVEGIRVSHPSCVSKTFPEYFARLEGLGLRVTAAG